jgi:hypothetical protein
MTADDWRSAGGAPDVTVTGVREALPLFGLSGSLP